MWNRTDAPISSKRRHCPPSPLLRQRGWFRAREASSVPKSHSEGGQGEGGRPSLHSEGAASHAALPEVPKVQWGGSVLLSFSSTAWRVPSGHSLGSVPAPAVASPPPRLGWARRLVGLQPVRQGCQPRVCHKVILKSTFLPAVAGKPVRACTHHEAAELFGHQKGHEPVGEDADAVCRP